MFLLQNLQFDTKYGLKSEAVEIFSWKMSNFWWNFCQKCLWPKIVRSDILCENIPNSFFRIWGEQTQDTGMKTSAQAFRTPHTASSHRYKNLESYKKKERNFFWNTQSNFTTCDHWVCYCCSRIRKLKNSSKERTGIGI